MIDGLFKARTDRFWNMLGRGLAGLGLRPNQITVIGLVLVAGNCALYLVHKDSVWFGVVLALAFAFDGLDGAVARITGSSSAFGGYLDAVVDRYQEMLVFLAVAAVEGLWPACFVAAAGSLLISYNKARTAIETPIDNDRWPDLLERLERIVLLCALLILAPLIGRAFALGDAPLNYGLWAFAALAHATAVQRFFRARALLGAAGPGAGR